MLSKNFIFLCVYIKMNTFALFTAKAWIKNDVKAIECGCEVWINQHLREKLDIANISDRTQYYS